MTRVIRDLVVHAAFLVVGTVCMSLLFSTGEELSSDVELVNN
jgi:hypothetical protein